MNKIFSSFKNVMFSIQKWIFWIKRTEYLETTVKLWKEYSWADVFSSLKSSKLENRSFFKRFKLVYRGKFQGWSAGSTAFQIFLVYSKAQNRYGKFIESLLYDTLTLPSRRLNYHIGTVFYQTIWLTISFTGNRWTYHQDLKIYHILYLKIIRS